MTCEQEKQEAVDKKYSAVQIQYLKRWSNFLKEIDHRIPTKKVKSRKMIKSLFKIYTALLLTILIGYTTFCILTSIVTAQLTYTIDFSIAHGSLVVVYLIFQLFLTILIMIKLEVEDCLE